MFTCHDIQELLEDYLANELSPQNKAKVETHLQGCLECRTALEELIRLDQLLKDIKWTSPSDALWTTYPARVRTRIALTLKKDRRRLLRLSLAVGTFASAAAILLVILIQPFTSPKSPAKTPIPLSPALTTARTLPKFRLTTQEKVYGLLTTYVSIPGASNKTDIASEIQDSVGRPAVSYLLRVLEKRVPVTRYTRKQSLSPEVWSQMRLAAIQLLAGFKDRRIIPVLSKVVHNELVSETPDYELCRKAIEALEEPKDKRSITTLVRWLDQEEIQIDILQAIAKIGRKGKTHLLALLYAEDQDIRNNAVVAVGELKLRSAVPMLIKMLQKRKERSAAIIALGKIGVPEAVPHLFELVRHKSSHDEAIAAIKKIGNPSLPYLKRYLKAIDNGTKRQSIEVLGEIDGVQGTSLLLRAGQDPNLAKEVITAVRDIRREQVTEFLIASLNNYRVAPQAIETLGDRGDIKAVPYLINALSQRRLQSKAHNALKEITQQDFEPDQRQWQRWWQEEKKRKDDDSKSGKIYHQNNKVVERSGLCHSDRA